MMKVLVLGGNGFVGRRLIDALAASGWAEPVAGVRRHGSSGVREIRLDATHPGEVARALEGMDAAVQCVAGDARSIVESARALFAAPSAVRIVHLSSMAVYGGVAGLIAEDAELAGDGGYAGAKVAAERLAAAHAATTVLRPGCIYGAASPQWTGRIAALLRARRIGDLGAAGDGCSNLVHVDDVVAAILATLRRDDLRGKAINLAMPGAPDWNDYFLAFARALGATPLAHVSALRLRIEAGVSIPLALAGRAGLSVPPPITPGLLRLWRQDIRLDIARAQEALGLAWTPLAAGLAEAAASLRA